MHFAKKIDLARQALLASMQPLVLTGAGISVASGLPTFRGNGGALWRNAGLLKYAHVDILDRDPVGAWQAHESMRLLIEAQRPNEAHHAIHRWLAARPAGKLFTQNVDGYHNLAGDEAGELHGNISFLRCRKPGCGHFSRAPQGTYESVPSCPSCGCWLRHDAVLFGEPVRHAREFEDFLDQCDLVMFVGTSGLVTDTRAIAKYARGRGIQVLEIDPAWFTRATCWTTIKFREKAEYILPELVAAF